MIRGCNIVYLLLISQAPINAPESVVAIPIKSPGTPNAIAYDEKEKKVYWSDITYDNNKIVRSNLDGSDQEDFVQGVRGK